MNLRDVKLERAVRTLARARGIHTWQLWHPAGATGWLSTILGLTFAVILVASVAGVLWTFVLILISPQRFSEQPLPPESLSTQVVINRLAILFLIVMFVATFDQEDGLRFRNSRSVRCLRLFPVPDAVVRRQENPRWTWWLAFLFIWVTFAMLEWLHGARTLPRWFALPLCAALLTVLTISTARIVRVLVAGTGIIAWNTAPLCLIPVTLGGILTLDAMLGSPWLLNILRSPSTACVPTAWPFLAWQSGVALNNAWLWLAVVAAGVVWWCEAQLVHQSPISAQEVEAKFDGAAIGEPPLPSIPVGPADIDVLLARERIREQLVASGRERPLATMTMYERWLDWPARPHDLVVAEMHRWIDQRALPEWNLALLVAVPMLVGRWFSWFTGGYLGDAVLLVGAILVRLVLLVSQVGIRLEAVPVGFDESLVASLRVAASFLKRLVPWLVVYIGVLMVVERQSLLTATLTCTLPLIFVGASAPWLINYRILIPAYLATIKRFGAAIGTLLMVGSLNAVILLPVLVLNRVFDSAFLADDPRRFLAFFVQWLFYCAVATIVCRFLYRHSRLDLAL